MVTRAAAAVATNINMDGGDGDDFIELRGGTLSAGLAANAAGLVAAGNGATLTYMALGTTSNDRNLDVVTVDGGAGNDRIVLSGVASATINAGSGADIVSISMRGATSVNNYQLTLGAGADIIQLGVGTRRLRRRGDHGPHQPRDRLRGRRCRRQVRDVRLPERRRPDRLHGQQQRLRQRPSAPGPVGQRPAGAGRSRRRRRDQQLRDRLRDQQRLYGRVHGLQLRRLHRQFDADGHRRPGRDDHRRHRQRRSERRGRQRRPDRLGRQRHARRRQRQRQSERRRRQRHAVRRRKRRHA